MRSAAGAAELGSYRLLPSDGDIATAAVPQAAPAELELVCRVKQHNARELVAVFAYT
jgi:hypothetical protein